VRIIAGAFKGRRVQAPTWPGLRPTSDRLRETLFNLLATRVDGARVVDGFAGTGAVGIEALSRGAAHVTFIEQDRRAVTLIARNLVLPGLEGRYTIERGDVAAVLRRRFGPPFDLILLDPPYDHAGIGDLLLAASARVRPEGLVILERATRREPEIPPALVRVRDVRAGDSTLTLLAPRAGATGPPEPS
jgi:16S rRNA (guanine(966)-N(2))-methyltransferase RsmD